VLLLGGNGEAEIGTPMVDGARVVAEVIEHGRGRKIIVFKYKNKTRYRRKAGHRQEFTRLSVKEIVTASGAYTAEAPEKKKPTRKSRASLAEEVKAEVPVETEAVVTEAPEAIAEVPEAGTKPKAVRKATARKAAADGDSEDKPKPRARTTKPKAEPEAKEPSSDVESTEETE